MRAKVAGSSSRTFLIASRPLLPPVSFGSWNASFSASRNAVDILSRAALCRPRLGLPGPKRVEGDGLGFAMRAADYHHSGRLTTLTVRLMATAADCQVVPAIGPATRLPLRLLRQLRGSIDVAAQ